jgi:hypothetical protein
MAKDYCDTCGEWATLDECKSCGSRECEACLRYDADCCEGKARGPHYAIDRNKDARQD